MEKGISEKILSSGGIIWSHHPNYEFRLQQVEMAKAAIQRQLNPEADPSLDSARDGLEFPPKEEVVVPKPKKENNGNGRPEGRGLASDSQNHKPQLKNPDAPATKKQKSLIIRLAKERGQFIENLNSLTMQEASQTIDELIAVAV